MGASNTGADDWIDTALLIGRLPAPSATLRRIVSLRRDGRRDFPVTIPLHQAVALAAAAQAHARGVKRTQKVFDDVQVLGHLQPGYLVVLAKGKPPQFVRARDFHPIAAVVLDLDEIRSAIVQGDVIEH